MLVGVRSVTNLAFEQLPLTDMLFSFCLNVHDAMFSLHVDDVRGDIMRLKLAHDATVFSRLCLDVGVFILGIIFVPH